MSGVFELPENLGETYYSNITMSTLNIVCSYVDATEGGILVLFNFYLAIVIFLSEKLRSQKEYVLIALTIVFDGFFVMAYFLDCLYYLQVYYTHECKENFKFYT